MLCLAGGCAQLSCVSQAGWHSSPRAAAHRGFHNSQCLELLRGCTQPCPALTADVLCIDTTIPLQNDPK